MNTNTNDVCKTEYIACRTQVSSTGITVQVSPPVNTTIPLPLTVSLCHQSFLRWPTTASWALLCARSVHSGRQVISFIIFIFTFLLFYFSYFLFRLQRNAEAFLMVVARGSQSPSIHPALLSFPGLFLASSVIWISKGWYPSRFSIQVIMLADHVVYSRVHFGYSKPA
jgi:hypothetical protein